MNHLICAIHSYLKKQLKLNTYHYCVGFTPLGDSKASHPLQSVLGLVYRLHNCTQLWLLSLDVWFKFWLIFCFYLLCTFPFKLLPLIYLFFPPLLEASVLKPLMWACLLTSLYFKHKTSKFFATVKWVLTICTLLFVCHYSYCQIHCYTLGSVFNLQRLQCRFEHGYGDAKGRKLG